MWFSGADGQLEGLDVSEGRFEVVLRDRASDVCGDGIVREQFAALGPSCDAFLVPDSHLGRATVSFVAGTHEVAYLQSCFVSRRRNGVGAVGCSA